MVTNERRRSVNEGSTPLSPSLAERHVMACWLGPGARGPKVDVGAFVKGGGGTENGLLLPDCLSAVAA